MAGPIKPDEVVSVKETLIPDAVFEVFNQLIAENWNGSSSTFKQKEVTSRLFERGEIDAPSLTGIEDVYRKAGWKVVYDAPGYCESYDATFKFTKV